MAFVVIWKVWRWSPFAAAALMLPFLLIDITFLGANLLKVADGGWVPLALGGVLMVMMYTWRRGSRLLFEKTRRQETPLVDLVRMLERKPPARVPGMAVFLTSDPASAPTALLHSLKHYKVLHEQQRHPHHRDRRRAARRPRRAGADRAGRRNLHPHRPAVRVHGVAEHAEGARDGAQAQAAPSTSCRRRSSCRAGTLKPAARLGHAALAGPAVHPADAARQ